MSASRQSIDIDPFATRVGDIAFVRKRGWTSSISRTYQRVFALRWNCEFTHVLLCVHPGVFIHSTYPGGIGLIDFQDPLWREKNPEHFMVLRNAAIAADPSLQSQLSRRAMFHFRKRYNITIQLRALRAFIPRLNAKNSMYCSEFIHAVFDDIGIRLANRPSIRTLPIHLEVLAQRIDWENVAGRYRHPPAPTDGWFGDAYETLVSSAQTFIRIWGGLYSTSATLNEMYALMAQLGEVLGVQLETVRSIPIETAREVVSHGSIEQFYRYFINVLRVKNDWSRMKDLPLDFWSSKPAPQYSPLVDGVGVKQIREWTVSESRWLENQRSSLESVRVLAGLILEGYKGRGSNDDPEGLFRQMVETLCQMHDDFCPGGADYSSDLEKIEEFLKAQTQRDIPTSDLEDSLTKYLTHVVDIRKGFLEAGLRQEMGEWLSRPAKDGAARAQEYLNQFLA